jgi:VWFA-related protein
MQKGAGFFAFLIFLCLLYLTGPAASPASAVGQEAAAQKPLQYEVNVVFKLIQVYAVDRKGNPVTDLTAADFELTDDGKKQKIEHFEKVQLDLPAPPATPSTVDAAPVLVRASIPRKFFLFFNYAFIEPAGIQKSQKAALEFLDKYVRPADEIGVITFSRTKGLTINEFLTTDHRRIRDALLGQGSAPMGGRAEQMARLLSLNVNQFVDDSIQGTDPEVAKNDEAAKEIFRTLISAETKSRLEDYSRSVGFFLDALRGLAQGLRFLPGTKNIVMFSTGVSGISLFGSPSVNIPENLNNADNILKWQDALAVKDGDPRLREIFENAMDLLKAANCPVFSFNVSGAQYATNIESFGLTDNTNPTGLSAKDTYGNDSLRVLSSGTGGQYFHNTMDPKTAIGQLQKTTSSYYVLGYATTPLWDGKYHKIKVKVGRRGVDVYGENGYANPKPFGQYSNFERFVHIMDLAEGKTPYYQEDVRLSMAALSVPVKDKAGISLFGALPAESFRILANGPSEVVIIIANARNRISYFKRIPLHAATLADTSVFYDQAAGLPPGEYDCRMVVYHLETGRGVSAATSVIVPRDSPSPGINLFPAHLFLDGPKPRYHGDIGALGSAYPFGTGAWMPVIEGVNKDCSKLIAIVPCRVSGIPNPEITFGATLTVGSAGVTRPVEIAIKNSYESAGVLFFLAEIPLSGLEPGPASLFLTAEEKSTGTRSHAATRFRIRE